MATTDMLGSFPTAATALGLGDQLAGQVRDETDEERKKRLRLLQQQQGPGSVLNSLSVQSLLGGGGAYGR